MYSGMAVDRVNCPCCEGVRAHELRKGRCALCRNIKRVPPIIASIYRLGDEREAFKMIKKFRLPKGVRKHLRREKAAERRAASVRPFFTPVDLSAKIKEVLESLKTLDYKTPIFTAAQMRQPRSSDGIFHANIAIQPVRPVDFITIDYIDTLSTK